MKTQILAILFLFLISNSLLAQEKVKDFSLPAVGDEKPFVLSEAKGKYVALHFLLKTECPYCIRHTNDYVEKTAGLDDVIQVFIKPDTEEEILSWAENLDEDSFTIYRDVDAQLADELGIPGEYSFHNQLVHYPALILIGPDGKEVYRYTGKKNSDRLSVKKFMAVLEGLRK
jgi:peroxiredoxin Q/BCP